MSQAITSSRLVKLTNLMRFLKVSTESDDGIDLSSLDKLKGDFGQLPYNFIDWYRLIDCFSDVDYTGIQ